MMRFLLVVGMSCVLLGPAHAQDAKPAPKLTPEQQAKIKDSQRYSKESTELERAGKIVEAITAAEKMLALEREVYGADAVHADIAGSLKRLARMHERLDDFAAAEKERRLVVALFLKLHGDSAWRVTEARFALKHLEMLRRMSVQERLELRGADDAMREAIDAYGTFKQDKYLSGAELAEKALGIRLRLLKAEHALTAASASWAAALWERTKQLDKARARNEQALAAYKASYGDWHPETAQILQNLARVAWLQLDYDSLISTARECLAIRRKIFGPTDPKTTALLTQLDGHVDALGAQARTAEAKDDWATARSQRDVLCQLRALRFGKDHWQVADARLERAHVDVLARLDAAARLELREAERWLAEGKEQLQDTSHAGGKAMALQPHSAGEDAHASSSALGAGQAQKARASLERALVVQQRWLGGEHVQTAATANALGLVLYRQGDYAAARPYYEQALSVRKKLLGAEHPQTALSLNNMGALLGCQGDYAGAQPYYEQALAVQKQLLGAEAPATCMTMNNLGSLCVDRRQYAEARQYFEQVLTIAQKRSYEYATLGLALNNLGTVLAAQGDFAGAQKHFEQAHELGKKRLGGRNADTAFALSNLAAVLLHQGKLAEARTAFERVLELRLQLLGEHHPDTVLAQHSLGMLLHRQGESDAGRRLVLQALETSRQLLDVAAVAQSERQQLLMERRLRYQLDNLLALPAQTGAANAATYDFILSWKGAVTTRQRWTRLARQQLQNEPATQALFAELDRVSRELSTLTALHAEPPYGEVAPRLAQLREQREKIEMQLSARTEAYRRFKQAQRLTGAQLQKHLPDGAVLLDFVESNDKLITFVVTKDQLSRVDLPGVKQIGEAVTRFRGTMQRTQPLLGADDPARVLQARLLAPLEQYFSEAKLVLIAPDGPLHALPFAALPGKAPGKYWIEEVHLAVFPVPQLLPELLAPLNPKRAQEVPSLFAVGDIAFDVLPAAAVPKEAVAWKRPQRAANAGTWHRLEGTRKEVDFLEGAFRKAVPTGKLTVLRDAQPTESAVRAQAPNFEYLHFATHGFFASRDIKSALHASPSDGANMCKEVQNLIGYHPGLLSGIVLAGANKPSADDDGILTALEVSELDLSRTELAVLSACVTGLGEVAGGEGVLGLQRAFQIAGARTTVTSLWKVDDEATRSLMERFYDNYWRKNMGTLAALREAQLWMLVEGVPRGVVRVEAPAQMRRAPPHYWAAFVLAGDWR